MVSRYLFAGTIAFASLLGTSLHARPVDSSQKALQWSYTTSDSGVKGIIKKYNIQMPSFPVSQDSSWQKKAWLLDYPLIDVKRILDADLWDGFHKH